MRIPVSHNDADVKRLSRKGQESLTGDVSGPQDVGTPADGIPVGGTYEEKHFEDTFEPGGKQPSGVFPLHGETDTSAISLSELEYKYQAFGNSYPDAGLVPEPSSEGNNSPLGSTKTLTEGSPETSQIPLPEHDSDTFETFFDGVEDPSPSGVTKASQLGFPAGTVVLDSESPNSRIELDGQPIQKMVVAEEFRGEVTIGGSSPLNVTLRNTSALEGETDVVLQGKGWRKANDHTFQRINFAGLATATVRIEGGIQPNASGFEGLGKILPGELSKAAQPALDTTKVVLLGGARAAADTLGDLARGVTTGALDYLFSIRSSS